MFTAINQVNPASINQTTFQQLTQAEKQATTAKHQAVVNKYTTVITDNPYDAWAYELRAMAYMRLGNTASAINDLQTAITLQPNVAQPFNTLGRVYTVLGDYNNAIGYCLQALNIDSATSPRNLVDALEISRWNVTPVTAQEYHDDAMIEIRKGNYQGALTSLNQAIALNSSYALAFNSRAYVQISLGNFSAAVNDATRAGQLDPSLPDTNLVMANANLDLITSAISINSSPTAAKYNLRALQFMNLRFWEKAKEDLIQATTMNNRYAEAFNNLGYVEMTLYNFKEAEAACATALQLDPTLPADNYNKATALWQDAQANADDLTVISGLTDALKSILVAAGITTLWKLANLTPTEITTLLGSSGTGVDTSFWPYKAIVASRGLTQVLNDLNTQYP